MDYLFFLITATLITKVTWCFGSVMHWWMALRGDKLDTVISSFLVSLGAVFGFVCLFVFKLDFFLVYSLVSNVELGNLRSPCQCAAVG